VAVASDGPVAGLRLPRLDLDDLGGIADFVLEHCGIAKARTRVV
jgi:hypothetical protein